MAISAFVVRVPAAEPLVGDLRARFDATVALGVPAHITLLVPFMAPTDITPAVLALARQRLANFAPFRFSLGTVGRFPETAYLAPEPTAPFIAMTRALAAAFPRFPPYGGEHPDIVPHLSVAHGNADDAATAAVELQQRLDALGAVQAECDAVVLLENSTGRWATMHVFDLVPPAGDGTPVSLVDFMQRSPLVGADDVVFERDTSLTRKTDH